MTIAHFIHIVQLLQYMLRTLQDNQIWKREAENKSYEQEGEIWM